MRLRPFFAFLFITITFFVALQPAAAQNEMIQQLMQNHMYSQGTAYQGQAYTNYQNQFSQMVNQLRSNVAYMSKAKERLPKLESTALKLMEDIPGMTTEVDGIRKAYEEARTKRNEVARALATAKLNQGNVAQLEESLKEARVEQSKWNKELETTASSLARAKSKLKKTAGEIYKIHAVLGTAPSRQLTDKSKDLESKKPAKTENKSATKRPPRSVASKSPSPAEPEVERQPVRKPPTKVSSARIRKWVSADGKFEVFAKLLARGEDNVVIRDTDGQELTVPLTALSKQDHVYLESVK